MNKDQPFKRKKQKKAKPSTFALAALLIMVGLLVFLLDARQPRISGDELRLDEFNRLLVEGRIKDVKLLDVDGFIVGHYAREDGTDGEYKAEYLKGHLNYFTTLGLQSGIPFDVNQQNGKRIAEASLTLLPLLILALVFVYFYLSYRDGSGLFGSRSNARKVGAGDTGITFEKVAGHDEAIGELREVVDFLKNPSKFKEIGATIPKGILLYGPPGCGKTLLAKALATEAGASFYSMSGSDFIEVFVGVGAARVRDLFRLARENVPAIVFIDELDSIGRSRAGGEVGVHGEQEQAVNQILAEMDGFSPFEGIVVVAATNRPDVLDPALLRPGRFDRTIGLERPGEQARLLILQVHAQGKKLDESVDLAAIAEAAVGMSGADLASVMNEASLLAGRESKSAITQEELDRALRRILDEPDRQRRLSLRDRSVGRRPGIQDRVTFADVAGIEHALEELREVTEYLSHPDRFARIGARVPKGILLEGPPGVGKTLLARAVAGEANATFVSVAATEFVEVFVGQGAGRVRNLFAEARGLSPAIVFIDEIDAVGGRRMSATEGGRERENTLNQLLVEMDGFDTRGGLVVIAATNRSDMLDPALVRPGRFDRTIQMELPDRSGRRAILELHASGKPMSDEVSLDEIASLTRGFSGADLANLMNEAALLCARRGAETINSAVMEEAIDRAILGISSRGQRLTDEERRTVAYHEAGHALVGRALPGASAPHKLSLASRGRALGFVMHANQHDSLVRTRSQLIDEIAALLGGRAAEELTFGDPSGGAGDDLSRSSEIARRMVRQLGLSSLGPQAFPSGDPTVDQSEEVTSRIDEEVTKIVEDAYGRAMKVLADERGHLTLVAERLIVDETLSADEMEKIISNGRL